MKKNPNISITNEKKMNWARIGHSRMTQKVGHQYANNFAPYSQSTISSRNADNRKNKKRNSK